MPVTYIIGNALDFPEDTNVLLHGVSTLPKMGKGIAKQIKEEYPAAFEAHTTLIDKGEAALGRFSTALVAAGTKRIINLISQTIVGEDCRQVDYEALYVGLCQVRDILEDAGKQGRVYRLAMPWIGCGLAGGSKTVVRAMIEDIFGESPIEVFVVEYAKSSKTSDKSDKTP